MNRLKKPAGYVMSLLGLALLALTKDHSLRTAGVLLGGIGVIFILSANSANTPAATSNSSTCGQGKQMDICPLAKKKALIGVAMILLSMLIVQFLSQMSHWLFGALLALGLGLFGAMRIGAYYVCLKDVADGKSDGDE